MDFIKYIEMHVEWSRKTFGPGRRTEGLLRHIGKELDEVRAKPTDVYEWVDIIILALDGAWRAGYSPEEVKDALVKKQAINFARKYPFPASENEPSEHEK